VEFHKRRLLKIIGKAQRNIYIATPYFVPDDSILETLKIAALSGLDVRLIIPEKKDHMFVHWASLSYIGELLEAGVKCYQYNDSKGFLHSKVIMADGFVSSVGTANMDVRSFKYNFEVNAFIYDEEVYNRLEEGFLRDLQDCTEITLEDYLRRPLRVRVKESISRLLSPLL
jgi:cardiolipin synthase